MDVFTIMCTLTVTIVCFWRKWAAIGLVRHCNTEYIANTGYAAAVVQYPAYIRCRCKGSDVSAVRSITCLLHIPPSPSPPPPPPIPPTHLSPAPRSLLPWLPLPYCNGHTTLLIIILASPLWQVIIVCWPASGHWLTIQNRIALIIYAANTVCNTAPNNRCSRAACILGARTLLRPPPPPPTHTHTLPLAPTPKSVPANR